MGSRGYLITRHKETIKDIFLKHYIVSGMR